MKKLFALIALIALTSFVFADNATGTGIDINFSIPSQISSNDTNGGDIAVVNFINTEYPTGNASGGGIDINLGEYDVVKPIITTFTPNATTDTPLTSILFTASGNTTSGPFVVWEKCRVRIYETISKVWRQDINVTATNSSTTGSCGYTFSFNSLLSEENFIAQFTAYDHFGTASTDVNTSAWHYVKAGQPTSGDAGGGGAGPGSTPSSQLPSNLIVSFEVLEPKPGVFNVEYVPGTIITQKFVIKNLTDKPIKLNISNSLPSSNYNVISTDFDGAIDANSTETFNITFQFGKLLEEKTIAINFTDIAPGNAYTSSVTGLFSVATAPKPIVIQDVVKSSWLKDLLAFNLMSGFLLGYLVALLEIFLFIVVIYTTAGQTKILSAFALAVSFVITVMNLGIW